MIEVLSPSTTRNDRTTKLQLYARYAVPYYWIVNAEQRAIEVYRLAANRYEAPETFGDDLTDLQPFDGLRLDPASLWVH